MGFHTVVANLLKQGDHRPAIKFEDIPLCSTATNKPDTDSRFYMISSDCVIAENGKVGHGKRFKALSKGGQAAAILVQLLNPRAETAYQTARPIMHVGDAAIVVDEAYSDSHEIDAHSWNLFISTEFHFPSVTSTQHLQISCPTLKCGTSALFTRGGTPCFDRIGVISGVCTFNGGLLLDSISASQSGKIDVERLAQAKPTFHEADYIARSSSAIADVAAMVMSRIREHRSGQRVNITLDVPSWHYYHSAVTKFAQRRCTATEALVWMDAVDQRHDQIGEAFMHSVQHELGKRGIVHGHSGYEIRISSRTTSAALSIRKALCHGEVPSLEGVLQGLYAEADGLWRDFYSRIPERERPKDLEGLGYLYYIFEVAKLALAKHVSANEEKRKAKSKKPRRLVISVDDPAERRVYSRAQEVLRKIRASSDKADSALVEIYLCRRVVVNGNRRRARLYHHDPMPEVPVGYETDPVQSVLPLDVVRRLYGTDCAQNLQRWFADVGL